MRCGIMDFKAQKGVYGVLYTIRLKIVSVMKLNR